MANTTELLNKMLSSEVKGDLLVLFRKNPGIIDTMEGVARRIGRRPQSVETDVRDLVNIGMIKTKKIGTMEVFSLDYAKDMEIQKAVEEHFKSLKPPGGH
ncbi:MAG: hypothetical protein HYU39_04875 [Thaumarchaeota archaeon]|nr:hypothetical protein [Nitrososphaerota archaeon]